MNSRTRALAKLAAIAAMGQSQFMVPNIPDGPKPRAAHEIEFTPEELEELRSLPKRERQKRVAELKAKRRA